MSLESNTGATKKDSNFKLITTTTGIRVSQACDRCRVKKIKCDGLTPCHNCSRIGFECKTSDKLTRRAFPKGYTENLEKKLGELEEEVQQWRNKFGENGLKTDMAQTIENNLEGEKKYSTSKAQASNKVLMTQPNNQTVQINNPIDQIFNLNENGIIIGNDNLNFESQFNHLLINLNLPFLKITNSHNYLLNDPNSYLYNPSYTNYNQMTNKDLEVIYNPLTGAGKSANELLPSNQLPFDIYGLFIKLINNFKTLFSNKKELDIQVTQYFLNYNSFIPIFDYEQFMQSYDAFHTMYPFMFTYDDATINGFNLSSNDYQIVNQFLMTVIQLYAMIMINDPTINLNLLLTHSDPSFSLSRSTKDESESILKSLYDFLPYINFFHVSIVQLQTYQLFLLYSLLTNNKEKSLVLSSLINSFIGILGINLNCKNLFFNDLSLPLTEKRTRVKIFWVFKVLLKCFNLKFGFKPSLNTTVINPVTIDKYFQLTPEKLSSLLGNEDEKDSLFETLLRPSVEFLNLMNIIIPSSFSPNYYQYLKGKNHGNHGPHGKKGSHPKDLDWILNDDDGDGNDGNLNYNFTQFLIIDENLANWRESLKERTLDLSSLQSYMNLPAFNSVRLGNLHFELKDLKSLSAMSQDSLLNYFSNDVPDIHSASQLIKIQLNFHYLLIRSMNYLNFIIDKELTHSYYLKIAKISQEILIYFLLIFNHVGQSPEVLETKKPKNVVMESLGIDIDEDGFVINDFSAKRGRNGARNSTSAKKKLRKIPPSPFNYMLNGLSMTNINLKKSIIFQMLYLLICQLRFYKKNELHLIKDSFQILSQSVTVFIRVFINYDLESVKKHPKKLREDDLFRKIMSDELKEEILKEHDSDNEEENELPSFNDIDWDDEEMDEDLKYLKILKFVKYKSHVIHNYSIRSNSLPTTSGHAPSEVNVPLTTPKANDVSLAPSVGNLYPESTIQTATKFDVSLTNESFANQLIRSRLPKQSDGDIMKNETFKEDIANIKNGSNHNSHPLSNGQWT